MSDEKLVAVSVHGQEVSMLVDGIDNVAGIFDERSALAIGLFQFLCFRRYFLFQRTRPSHQKGEYQYTARDCKDGEDSLQEKLALLYCPYRPLHFRHRSD